MPAVGREWETSGRPRRAPPGAKPNGLQETGSEMQKHTMCRTIVAGGKCSWGDRCWFAHSRPEQAQGVRERKAENPIDKQARSKAVR